MKISLFILILLVPFYCFSEELYDIRKIDDNVILLRFSDRVEYNTKLTNDKKNIFLTVKNTSNSSAINNIRIKSSLIKEVFVQKENINLIINIMLNSSSGFNVYQLPYSNSIIIDVFDWMKVNNIEDKFRSGLFAYESSLYNQSILFFESSKNEILEAQSLLGIIYLLEDSLELSYHNLIESAKNKTYIPDVYAALSQIYNEKGSKTKSTYFQKIFFEKLGIKDSLFEYPRLIFNKTKLEQINTEESIDSSAVYDITETENSKRFSNLFDEKNSKTIDNNNAKKSIQNDNSFLDFKGFLKYIIIVFGLLVLFILSIYLKWRKNKIELQNKSAKKDFEKELKQVIEKDKSSQSIVIDKTDEETKEFITKTPINSSLGLLSNHKNIKIENVELKIESKKILSKIDFDANNSNIDLSADKMDNNVLKSKLYSKFNVDKGTKNKK